MKPYQPDGVWEAVSMGGNTRNCQRDNGDGLYRRSMYRSMYWFWKRSLSDLSAWYAGHPDEAQKLEKVRSQLGMAAVQPAADPTPLAHEPRPIAVAAAPAAGASGDHELDDRVAALEAQLADLTARLAALEHDLGR